MAESQEEIPYHRQNDFYAYSDRQTFMPNVFMKHHFCPETNGYFIHWMRVNDPDNKHNVSPSHQFVSRFELDELEIKLDAMLRELLGLTSMSEYSKFINNPLAKEDNRNKDVYWDPSLTESIGSQTLKFRPARNARGCWTIRILAPKNSQPNWAGVVINFNLGEMRGFLKRLAYHKSQIDLEEVHRIRGPDIEACRAARVLLELNVANSSANKDPTQPE